MWLLAHATVQCLANGEGAQMSLVWQLAQGLVLSLPVLVLLDPEGTEGISSSSLARSLFDSGLFDGAAEAGTKPLAPGAKGPAGSRRRLWSVSIGYSCLHPVWQWGLKGP